MLTSAGLSLEVIRPLVDEVTLQGQFQHLSPSDLALQLAHAKALSVSTTHPDRLVIGADQTLECDGELYHKARSITEATRNLRKLSGKTHHLHSAVSLVFNDQELFCHTSRASLTMWPLSEAFMTSYASREAEALLQSVGGYHFEGFGVQLFEKVEGDIHTILGLPLLPLLAFLRSQAIIGS